MKDCQCGKSFESLEELLNHVATSGSGHYESKL